MKTGEVARWRLAFFEIITGIIRAHGPAGDESEDNVHLILA